MSLNIESCDEKEMCTAMEGSEKLLLELRHRLQEWLKFQQHLPQDIPSGVLDYLIFGTKMSLEKAKRKLEMFYTMRILVPEFFENRDPREPNFTRLRKMVQFILLPKLTPEKYRVYVLRANSDNYNHFDSLDTIRYFLMIEDMMVADRKYHHIGMTYILDASKMTFGLFRNVDVALARKLETVVKSAYAKRIKEIHVINVNSAADATMKLFMRILHPKLTSRVHVHSEGDYQSLHRHLPKSILPKDYEGDELPLDTLASLLAEAVDAKREWFLEQNKIVVNENLRAGPVVNHDDIFGFCGSFRKLDVD